MAEDPTREDVAEETTPETDEQAVEQRTDDYEGLKRIIEEGFDSLRALIEGISAKMDDADAEIVESGTVIVGGDEAESDLEEDIEDGEADDVIEDIISGGVSLEELMTDEEA